MSTIASQITGVSIVCSIVCSGADQRKRQISLALSPLKKTVTRKTFPIDDVMNVDPLWFIRDVPRVVENVYDVLGYWTHLIDELRFELVRYDMSSSYNSMNSIILYLFIDTCWWPSYMYV